MLLLMVLNRSEATNQDIVLSATGFINVGDHRLTMQIIELLILVQPYHLQTMHQHNMDTLYLQITELLYRFQVDLVIHRWYYTL